MRISTLVQAINCAKKSAGSAQEAFEYAGVDEQVAYHAVLADGEQLMVGTSSLAEYMNSTPLLALIGKKQQALTFYLYDKNVWKMVKERSDSEALLLALRGPDQLSLTERMLKLLLCKSDVSIVKSTLAPILKKGTEQWTLVSVGDSQEIRLADEDHCDNVLGVFVAPKGEAQRIRTLIDSVTAFEKEEKKEHDRVFHQGHDRGDLDILVLRGDKLGFGASFRGSAFEEILSKAGPVRPMPGMGGRESKDRFPRHEQNRMRE